MPAAKLGRGSFIRLGEESTWGSAASTTVSNRIASQSLQRNQERSQKTHLSTSAGVFSFGSFDGFELCEGDVELPIGYNGNGLLIKAACGALATTGAGPTYTHTYTAGTTGDLPSLTINVQRGNSSSELFKGMKVSTMGLSIEAGGQMMGSFSFVGSTSEARTTAATASFNNTNKDVFHYESAALVHSLFFNRDDKPDYLWNEVEKPFRYNETDLFLGQFIRAIFIERSTFLLQIPDHQF